MQALDQSGAAHQHGALVDVAFVGDLVGVDRRRLLEDQHAFRQRRAAGRVLRHGAQRILDARAHSGVADERRHRRVSGNVGAQSAAGVDIGEDEQPDLIPIVAGDHGILDHRTARRNRAHTHAADVHPSA